MSEEARTDDPDGRPPEIAHVRIDGKAQLVTLVWNGTPFAENVTTGPFVMVQPRQLEAFLQRQLGQLFHDLVRGGHITHAIFFTRTDGTSVAILELPRRQDFWNEVVLFTMALTSWREGDAVQERPDLDRRASLLTQGEDGLPYHEALAQARRDIHDELTRALKLVFTPLGPSPTAMYPPQ